MNYESFHEKFSNALSSKIPNRKALVDFISRELDLDKRAVYRRLDGDHQFRINEVLEISSLLDIPLDSIGLKRGNEYQNPSVVYYPFGKMTEKEYRSFNDRISKYKLAIRHKESYALLSYNILPDIFCFQHEYLLRFYRLKWGYYMGSASDIYQMDDEPLLQPAHLSAVRDYIQTVLKFPKILIIWDYNIIPSVIKDIDYFTQIGFVSPEHRARLKEELLLIIDKIDDLCRELTSAESAGNFNFAISSTYLPKSHTIYKGPDFKISVDSAFYTTYLHISDPRIIESVEHIILATLKSSVIISQSNESERLKFIADQKMLIERI